MCGSYSSRRGGRRRRNIDPGLAWRAEATRRRLFAAGVPEIRFERIEGVADREPMIVENPADPRNRRVSITLLYRKVGFQAQSGGGRPGMAQPRVNPPAPPAAPARKTASGH